MTTTDEFWIIEVAPNEVGAAKWATSGRRDRKRSRLASCGLVVAVGVLGALAVLGYLAYLAWTLVLALLPAALGVLALGGVIFYLQMIMTALVFAGRWTLIRATGGIRPSDILAALELGRWLHAAWRGS